MKYVNHSPFLAGLLAFFLFTSLMIPVCPVQAASSAATHSDTKTITKTTTSSLNLPCKKATRTYTVTVSSSTRAISGRESVGSGYSVIGSYTGTQQTKVTETYTKGKTTKIRRTSVTTKKTYTMTANTATTLRILSTLDARVKKAWNTLGFSFYPDAGQGAYCMLFSGPDQKLYYNEECTYDYLLYMMGHFVSMVSGNRAYTALFQSIWNQEKEKYKGFWAFRATYSPVDFFCSCLYSYYKEPSQLKATCPKAYAYLEESFEKVTDARIRRLQQLYQLQKAS